MENPLARRFRKLHQDPGGFVIPNPWDAGTARILAALGFPALATTSAGMAFSLGLREGQAGREAVLAHCRTIVDATDLPVSADLEKGFGDSPESTAETIRAAIGLGLAGSSIEDHTGLQDDPIYDFTLAVERIQAASEAARAACPDFVLTARCENLLWGRPNLDDVILRLQAFEKAGADVVYAPGLRTLADIRTVCASVSLPVNVVVGLPGAAFTLDELVDAGVKRVSVGSSLARLAYGTFVRAAQQIRESESFSLAEGAMSFGELEEFFPAPPPPDRPR